MQRSQRTGSRTRRWAAVLAAGLLAAAPLAQAQNFEGYYGHTAWRDAAEDIKAVQRCPGGGSITAGTRLSKDGEQVLVTRLDDVGASDNPAADTWQRAYAVAGSKSSQSFGIVELYSGKGFVLTGSVGLGEGRRLFVMHIDCEGRPVWTTLLDNRAPDNIATGYDVIESGVQSGRARVAAAVSGEVVVAGEEVERASRSVLGRIARLDAGGNLLWDHRYDGREFSTLRFRAIAENLDAAGAYSDLVVAGSAASPVQAARSGLLFRTDGGGMPLCASILGDGKEHRDFHGLTPMLGARYLGDTVAVGASAAVDPGAIARPYLVRYARGGCAARVQAVWNDPARAGFTAFDVVEARNVDGLDGALAVAGTIAGTQGFVFAARPSDLTQYGASPIARRFGSQSRESLYAIDIKRDRFVLAGNTQADWASAGDPQDAYVVQVDPALATQCSIRWEPKGAAVQLPLKELELALERNEKFERADVGLDPASDWGHACKVDPPESCPGVIDNGTVRLGVSNTGYLNVECPKIGLSSGRYGTTLVGLRYMPTNGEASAPGTPCEGWGVANADPAALVSGHSSRCYGNVNVAPVLPFNTTASTATSVAQVGSTFEVTHKFTPLASTNYLYRVDVSIRNIGRSTVKDLRYSRGIDYDVPPNTFSEYITLAGSSPWLLAWNSNGFNSFDPLAANSGTPGPLTDQGPNDLGAHMDLALGSLEPGATRSLVTYYGAAPTERDALNALSIVGAGLYSLGQSNWDGVGSPGNTSPTPGVAGRNLGVPATFMYGVQSQPAR